MQYSIIMASIALSLQMTLFASSAFAFPYGSHSSSSSSGSTYGYSSGYGGYTPLSSRSNYSPSTSSSTYHSGNTSRSLSHFYNFTQKQESQHPVSNYAWSSRRSSGSTPTHVPIVHYGANGSQRRY